MRTEIINYLKEEGILFSTKGFKYLCDAIAYAMEAENTEIRAMELYSVIGKKHGATAHQVERAMRYSIRRSGCSDYVKEFIVKAAVILKEAGVGDGQTD